MDRRQRQREATMAEIREVARRQLAVTGAAALSLRAVAREMGLTAPALYRYYDDRNALLTALIVEAYQGLNDALDVARESQPAGDHAARLVATGLAWREWSVRRPHEFSLVFGSPVPGYAAPEQGPTQEQGQRFGAVFLEQFLAVHTAAPFATPPADHRTPALEGALDAAGRECGGGPLPGPAMQVFVESWASLHGLISLEVFGHLHWLGLPDHEALFRAEMAAVLERLGLDAACAQRLPTPAPLARTA